MNFASDEEAYPISLGQQVKCRHPNCGVWGLKENKHFCSLHFKEYMGELGSITDDAALRWLLQEAGFQSINSVKEQLALEKLGLDRALTSDIHIPGLVSWKTFVRPLTQYDKVPHRGTAACSYISGCAAINSILVKAEPDGDHWAEYIRRGVEAFRIAKSHSPQYKSVVNLGEVLGYILKSLEISGKDASRVELKETMGLLSVERVDPTILESVKESGTHSIFSLADLQHYFAEKLDEPWSAVVVTRQNETWSVLRGTEKVFFRDSHRRVQIDFSSLSVFINWLSADESYFVPMPEMDATSNELSLTEIVIGPCASKPDSVSADMSLLMTRPLPFEYVKTTQIYLSTAAIARDEEALKMSGITHILNLSGYAKGDSPFFANLFPSPAKYLHVNAAEILATPGSSRHPRILQILGSEGIFNFIDRTRQSHPGNKILIHADQEYGLSTALVIAYLMSRFKVPLTHILSVIERTPDGAEPDISHYKELLELETLIQGKSSVSMASLLATHALNGPLEGWNIPFEKVESMMRKCRSYEHAVQVLLDQGIKAAGNGAGSHNGRSGY